MNNAATVFTLEEQNASLISKSDRIEHHGEEKRLACDLDFSIEVANTALALFAPALRSCLYQRDQGAQVELPGTEDPQHTPSLRFPALGSLKWGAGELIGAELRFHGVNKKSDVVFDETKIHKYKIQCKEGGTVIITFQAQVRPDEHQAGRLSKFLQDKVCQITVTPPPPPADLAE